MDAAQVLPAFALTLDWYTDQEREVYANCAGRGEGDQAWLGLGQDLAGNEAFEFGPTNTSFTAHACVDLASGSCNGIEWERSPAGNVVGQE